MNKNLLIKNIKETLLNDVKHFFHKESNTHIHYSEKSISFKGFGTMPNESFYNYNLKLNEIETFSDKNLILLDKIINGKNND